MTAQFTHLHMHSQYSLLDGAVRLKDLFPRLQELKMDTVALTDHGNLFGVLDFYKQARAAGVKPILGCETYICSDRHDRQNRRNYHLILLARNQEGWKNLSYLNSMAFLEGFYYHPRIDKQILRQHRGGLIGLSSCLGGELAETLLKHGYEQARELAKEYKDIFEPGAFYLEVQPNGLEDQQKINEAWRRLSREENIPLVATGDCHYIHESDARAHEILMAIQTGKTLSDRNRLKHESAAYYLKSAEEFSAFFHDMPDALENTVRIANACRVELEMGRNLLPVFSSEQADPKGYFQQVAEAGLLQRFEGFRYSGKSFDPDQYRARLQQEMQVILQMGFESYFLIVWDFIQYAKKTGIPVGPGRGSGAGSLVAYAMQITDLDPIPYDLLFERFLNPERVSMPDFDIDFCMNRRDEVIQYVGQKYGKDRVGQIITFGSLSAKSALKDVGRVMGMPFAELNELTKNLPNLVDGHPVTLEWALQHEPKLKQAIVEKPQYGDLVDIAKALEGLHRNVGMHAAGIVIANGPLWDYVPCTRGQNGELVTQFAKDEVEQLGLVKFDFLGLKTLTVIDQAVRMVREKQPDFDLLRIPLDDAEVYQFVSDGNTVGVFQMESEGFTDLVRRLRPDCFEDIIAAGALYRPGPLEGGMVDDFINRKHGRTKIVYHHPAMEPILKGTYGVIVYQEQVMQIARALAGYSLGGADLLRRAMGKKKKEVMDQEKAKFLRGAEQHGVSAKIAAEVFDLMAAFAGYGFNKSHSAAYGLLTYQTAYLKRYYPHQFMASLMTCDKDDIDKVVKNVAEARSMGIVVLPPDINQSGMDFSVVPHAGDFAIRFGLSAIKGVGEGAVEAMLESRTTGGTFGSLFALCDRVDSRKVNKKALDALIKSGALDSIVPSRAQALASLDLAVDRAQKNQQDRNSGQTSLFGLLGGAAQASAPDPEPAYAPGGEFLLRQRLAYEKEALGFYMSGHPMDRYRADLVRAKIKSVEEVATLPERAELRVAGVVSDFRDRPLKSGGGRMAIFSLEDASAGVEVVCFSKPYASFEAVLKSGEPILLTGTLLFEGEADGKKPKVHMREAVLLSEWRKQNTHKMVIDFCAAEWMPDRVHAVQALLSQHPGEIPVWINLFQPAAWSVQTQLPCRVFPSDELLQHLEKICGPGTIRLA